MSQPVPLSVCACMWYSMLKNIRCCDIKRSAMLRLNVAGRLLAQDKDILCGPDPNALLVCADVNIELFRICKI